MSGHQWWVDNELKFGTDTYTDEWRTPLDAKPDGTYRTIFGPSVPIDAVIYQNNDDNVSKGLRRLTACRVPPLPAWSFLGWEEHLRTNQRQVLARNKELLLTMTGPFRLNLEPFTSFLYEAEEHHADTHPKKQLRIDAMRDMTATGVFGQHIWLKHVTYKMKKDEYAKPGKAARMIGDLKVPASLQGFRLTGMLKTALGSETYGYKRGHWRFCPAATADLLQEQMDRLICPIGRYYFVFFSDDSCLAVRSGDEVYRFNMDISSCDASHTDELFKLLSDLTPSCRQEVEALSDQCRCDIRIYSVNRSVRKREFVQLRPKGARLYSGSTLTTYINSISQLVMLSVFAELDFSRMDRAQCAAAIENACLEAGYVVTLEVCEEIEDIQFLKYSPTLDEGGRYRPLLNLGTVLRTSGVCRGDLPGRGDLNDRALEFQNGLMNGISPGSSYALLDVLRRRCGHVVARDEVKRVVESLLYNKTAGVSATFPDESMIKRYRLTLGEWQELVGMFEEAGPGDEVYVDAADKIMRKDYGYGLRLL